MVGYLEMVARKNVGVVARRIGNDIVDVVVIACLVLATAATVHDCLLPAAAALSDDLSTKT